MINESGKLVVFLVEEFYENDRCPRSIHDTHDGACKWLEEHGFKFLTNGAPGWAGMGWYRHDKSQWHDEWVKADIGEMEVSA